MLNGATITTLAPVVRGPMNLLVGAGMDTLWLLCMRVALARAHPAADAPAPDPPASHR